MGNKGGKLSPAKAPGDAQIWFNEEMGDKEGRTLYLWLERTKSDASKEVANRALKKDQNDENKYWYSFYKTIITLAEGIYVEEEKRTATFSDMLTENKWWIIGGVGGAGFLGVSYIIARAL